MSAPSRKENSVLENPRHLSVLLLLAWPAILEQLLLTLVNYVDTAMVGALGASATAAISINNSTIWLVNGILQMLSVGYSVQVAHSIGAGQREHTCRVIRQAVTAVAAGGLLLFAVGGLLAPHLPAWMGAEPEVLPGARAYLRIIFLALPFQTASAMFSAVLRCMGDTKTPLLFNTAGNLLNVALNFLFIYPTRTITLFGSSFTMWGAGGGGAGAARATALSTALVGTARLGCVFLRKGDYRIRVRESFRPEMGIIRRALRIGLPVGLERATISCGQLVMTKVVASMGTVALAANHVAVTAEGLSYLPAYGISYASTTLVGQCMGARRQDLAYRYGKLSGKVGFAFSTALGSLLFLLAPALASLFSPDPAVISLGADMLRIVALAQPLFGVSIVLSGALRGAEDSKYPFLVGLWCMWGIRVVLAPVFAYVLNMGLSSVWIAMAIDLCARGILCWRRFSGKRWIKNVDGAVPEEAPAQL